MSKGEGASTCRGECSPWSWLLLLNHWNKRANEEGWGYGERREESDKRQHDS